MILAHLVAFSFPNFIANNARRTLPPSIGNEGIMLKIIKAIFASKRRGSTLRKELSSIWVRLVVLKYSTPCNSTRTVNKMIAITKLTIGPIIAITNSLIGLSGIFRNRATPPIGSKIISSVSTLYRRAVSA